MPYIGEDMNASFFVQTDNETVTCTDELLFAYFGGLLGYDPNDLIGYGEDIIFTLVDNDLHFQLVLSDGSTSTDFAGTFTDIGTSTYQIIETFIENYQPSTNIDESALSLVNGNELKIETNVNLISSDGSETLVVSNYMSYDDSHFTQSVNGSAVTYVEHDDVATMPTIDAITGEISYQAVVDSTTYEPLSWNVLLNQYTLKNVLTADYFGTEENGKSVFVGGSSLASQLIAFLASIDVTGFTISGEATVTDGVITGLTFVTNEDAYGDSIEVNINFTSPQASDHVNVSLPSNPAGEAFKSKYITGQLDGTAPVEITVAEDDEAQVKAQFLEDIILISFPETTEEGILTYVPSYGYLLRDNKAILFEVADDGTVSATSTSYDATSLSDILIPFSISEKVIVQGDEANTYLVDGNVANFDLAFPYSEAAAMLDSSKDVVINVDGEHIVSMVVPYADYYSEGEQTFTFAYGEDVVTDEELLTAIRNVEDFVPPTSWLEEDATIYQTLVDNLGEEIASKIPYIYDETLTGGWMMDSNVASINIYNGNFSDSIEESAYIESWTEALVSNGFVLTDTQTLDYGFIVYTINEYTLGDIVIEVYMNSLYDGIYIYLLASGEA